MLIFLRSSIWLCWILYCLLPLVQCQFGGSPFDGSPFTGGFGRGPVGNGFPNPRFGNGRFPDFPQPFGSQRNQPSRGNGLQSLPQSPETTQTDPEPIEDASPLRENAEVDAPVEDPIPPAASPSPEPPAAVEAPPSIGPTRVTAAIPPPKPTSSSVSEPAAALPTSAPAIANVPASTQDAIAGVSTPVDVAPIFAPSSLNIEPESEVPLTGSSDSASPTSWTTTTTTIATTIMVTPSPTDDPSPGKTESPSANPALDLAPVSTSSGSTMSTSARVGVGIGVSFAIIAIAALAGFFLYRRHRKATYERNNRGAGLGGFFTLKRWKTSKSDSEWEIGDAEKIQIFSGASERTMSRSDSRSTATRPSRDGGRGGEGFGEKVKPALQIVKVGMRVPERPNLALTSNPPMPSPSQFPTPPSSRGKTDADQNASWPLPEKL